MTDEGGSRWDLAVERRAHGSPLMSVTQAMGRGLMAVLTRAEVVGAENLPATGSVLLASNHTDIVDGPLLYSFVRRPAVFFVKAEAFVGPIDPFLRRLGQIPIRRGMPEREPVRIALETLAAGGLVGVFPEGTRGAGEVSKVERGIAYLAVRSGAPVVPIVCAGTRAILRRSSLGRTPITIRIGEPIRFTAGPATRPAIGSAADAIQAALAELVRTGEA